ncbi:conserved hypothetical protein [Leptospira interrogans serovar Manilae]|uniref:Uncharacterized protein n=1 Tax=Leptospira interrogans serovar Manilae TaxID=214675 RepID=A0AAQ1SNZ0_LEPIR|nr:conserved hypothetical protein [Leptospira interrogans serovar Manilae]
MKNSIVEIHKTDSIIHFKATKTDGELIFNNSNVLFYKNP